MVNEHIILTSAWIVFCILHSVFASLWFKQKAAKWMGKKADSYRFLYTLFATVTFIAIIIYQLSVHSVKNFNPGFVSKIAGGLIVFLGLAVMLVCIKRYFMRLTGLGWLLGNDIDQVLLEDGIHRYVRHPLYAGTFVFIWGLWLIFPLLSLLISNSIITVYTLVGIQLEEQKLIKQFGEAYLLYRKKVPMLIPGF